MACEFQDIPDPGAWFDSLQSETKVKGKELDIFLKCCKGNATFIRKNVGFQLISGHTLCAELEVVDIDDMLRIAHFLGALLAKGQKINGETNQWSNGCFGSRWCDIDPEPFGCDHIRAAFYSKKHSKDFPEDCEFPFVISIIAEKIKTSKD